MDLPHRRVLQRDAFDQYILAAIRLNELGAKKVTGTKNSFRHGHTPFRHVKKQVPVFRLFRFSLLPSAARASLPWPPMFAIGIAVDGACARDGDVFLLEGVDEGRIVHQFHALPAGEDDRILTGVTRKAQRRPWQKVKIDLALQVHSPGHEFTRWNHYPAASGRAARRDRLAKGISAVSMIVADGAEFRHVEITIREDRRLDAAQDL